MLQLTRQTYFEADIIDQKREEEEQALLMAEEKERAKDKLAPAAGRPRVVISKAGKTAISVPLSSTGNVLAASPSIARRNSKDYCYTFP